MRFISKSSNLLIVLRPGLSAQPMTGTPAKPTVSVRFKEGLADVPDGELTDMMLAHAGYDSDFISADTVSNVDPYAYARQEVEPQHIVTELKFGSPVGRTVTSGKQTLPPELAKIVQDLAVTMAKEMLPNMVESVLKGIVQSNQGEKAAAKPVKGKPGRKPGKKPSVQTPVESVAPEANPLAQVEAA
jgi:hypothetical protein